MHEQHVSALLRRYASADAETLAAGRTWYAEAQAEARRLARSGPDGFGIVRAAAVLAVLSPGARWGQNVAAARAIVASGDPAAATAAGTYPANAEKAARILLGVHPATVVSGPKVSAFWRAICGDPAAMTLDRWAIRAADHPCDPWPGKRASAMLRDAYRVAAERAGETVRDFQAIVWIVERGTVPSDAITRMS